MTAGQNFRDAVQRGKEAKRRKEEAEAAEKIHAGLKQVDHNFSLLAASLDLNINKRAQAAESDRTYGLIVETLEVDLKNHGSAVIELLGYKKLYDACERQDVYLRTAGSVSETTSNCVKVVIDPGSPFVKGSVTPPVIKSGKPAYGNNSNSQFYFQKSRA